MNTFIQYCNNYLVRDIKLLVNYPRNFLYSFTLPASKKVRIKKYDPKTKAVANELITQINAGTSHTKIYFIGSSSLKILGLNDVDLIVATTEKNFEKNLLMISSIFGEPTKARGKFAEWEFIHKNLKVELSLMLKDSNLLNERVVVYKRLKQNKKLLAKYETLKKKSNGSSVREYQRRRMEFYSTII